MLKGVKGFSSILYIKASKSIFWLIYRSHNYIYEWNCNKPTVFSFLLKKLDIWVIGILKFHTEADLKCKILLKSYLCNLILLA